MMSAWRLGLSAMLICVQPPPPVTGSENSLMIWSNGSLAAMIALTTASGTTPGTRKSAANPSLWLEVSLLPTASFTAFERKALLIITGLPPSVVFTTSRNSASRLRLASSPGLGALFRLRWSVCVNSASVKCGVTYLLRLEFFQTSSDRPGPASPSSIARDCHQGRETPESA